MSWSYKLKAIAFLFVVSCVTANLLCYAVAQETYARVVWEPPPTPASSNEIGQYVLDRNGDWNYVASFGNDAQSKAEVESLWRQFRELKTNGPIVSKQDWLGAAIRVKTDVTLCPPIDHSGEPYAAFTKGFTVHLIITHSFNLKATNGFSLSVDSGEAQLIDSVRTTAFVAKVEVICNWNPVTRILKLTAIRANRPDLPAGPQEFIGNYSVTATSTTSTLARNSSANASFIQDLFNFGTLSVTEAGRHRLRVTLNGFGYRVTYARISLTRRDFGDNSSWLVLSIGANFLTEIDAAVTQTFASVASAQCSSTKNATVDVTIKDKYGVSFTRKSDAVCVASASQLPVTATFTARPTKNEVTQQVEGLLAASLFNVESNTNAIGRFYESSYQVGSGSGIFWALKADAGGTGRIDVSPPRSAPGGVVSQKFNRLRIR